MSENQYCENCERNIDQAIKCARIAKLCPEQCKKAEELFNASYPNWISVEDKLPSDCGHDWVLVQIQEDNGYLWIPQVAEYRKNKDDWYVNCNNVEWLKDHDGAFKVIAWCPLPPRFGRDSEP